MEDLITSAKAVIPSVDTILEQAWGKLELNRRQVKTKFGKVLVTMDIEATQIFRNYEKQALLKLAKKWLEKQENNVRRKLEKIVSQKGWENFVQEASQLFVEFGSLVQLLEKDLGNMRKARGGKTFEKVIIRLLNFINIQGEKPTGKAKERLRRIDIVLPSIEIALSTPDRAIFLTCKRTLRERWKQEVPQARPNQRIYLLTIDEELSESKAEEINEKGLIAFVQDKLKQKAELKEMAWIRKLSDLPKELQKV
jgi:hypothetical protein